MRSGEAKLISVAYDIAGNKRRRRVRKILKSYGVAVQYSLFECWLREEQRGAMRDELAAVVTEKDRIRFYDICRSCNQATITLGTGRKSREEESYIF